MHGSCKVALEFWYGHEPTIIGVSKGGTLPIVRILKHDTERPFARFIRAVTDYGGDDTPWTELCCNLDNIDVVRTLLENGWEYHINVRCGSLNSSALHLACSCPGMGNGDLVKLLLDHGADPHARNTNEETPLDVALDMNNWVCAEIFVARGFITTRAPRPWIKEMHQRWAVRWALVHCIKRSYRFPLEIVRDIMNWI